MRGYHLFNHFFWYFLFNFCFGFWEFLPAKKGELAWHFEACSGEEDGAGMDVSDADGRLALGVLLLGKKSGEVSVLPLGLRG